MNTTIPKTIEEATDALGGIGLLLTAKKWERAAIVYAFTEPQQGRRNFDGDPSRLAISDFAKLGIAGLTQREDVAFYRKCWQSAIDDGQAEPVEPGQKVKLPILDWPPFHRSGTEKERVARAVRNNPAVVAEVLRENPEPIVDELLAKDDPFAAKLSTKRYQAEDQSRDYTPMPPKERDYDALLRVAISNLAGVTKAMREGRWEPDALERALLYFATQLMVELTGGDKVADSLFGEIEKHLEEARA